MYASSFLKNHVNQLRDFIFDLIFPIECLLCGKEGAWLCKRCFSKLKFKDQQYCLSCKKENKFGSFCLHCQPNYYLDGVWIAGDYDDKILAQLIKNFKYRFAQDIALILGNFLTIFLKNLLNQYRITGSNIRDGQMWRKFNNLAATPQIFFDFYKSIIIPVPLHKKRLRWRGFNQSQNLTQTIGQNFNLKINRNLIRIKHKKPQAKLGEYQRKHNVKDCFAWQAYPLNNQNIILIDDVTTTGSTLNECAKILKKNGAKEVWGLVVAKG